MKGLETTLGVFCGPWEEDPGNKASLDMCGHLTGNTDLQDNVRECVWATLECMTSLL